LANHPPTTPYSPAEERLNILTHATGIVAALVAIVVLAAKRPNPWPGIVFGVAALAMFVTSALYHAAQAPERRRQLRMLDHAAIYVLIAGTYTPFSLLVLPSRWGLPMFAMIWAMAILGVVLRVSGRRGSSRLAVGLYLLMGWSVIVAIRPLADALERSQLLWLLAGGLAYTVGVPFYIWKRQPYTHAVWHLFVLAGVGCHFVAISSLR
jgi:hemolysin III